MGHSELLLAAFTLEPRAGPTGGDGLALPATSSSLIFPVAAADAPGKHKRPLSAASVIIVRTLGCHSGHPPVGCACAGGHGEPDPSAAAAAVHPTAKGRTADAWPRCYYAGLLCCESRRTRGQPHAAAKHLRGHCAATIWAAKAHTLADTHAMGLQ
jgi:hypothetical protein